MNKVKRLCKRTRPRNVAFLCLFTFLFFHTVPISGASVEDFGISTGGSVFGELYGQIFIEMVVAFFKTFLKFYLVLFIIYGIFFSLLMYLTRKYDRNVILWNIYGSIVTPVFAVITLCIDEYLIKKNSKKKKESII